MSSFNEAFNITIINHEGNYSNHPADTGGETYMGISRRYHPNWSGWSKIDEYKLRADFKNHIPHEYKDLIKDVAFFYKINYWDKVEGDNISNQRIANKLFDMAVSMGIKRTITFIQRSVNVLNKNQKIYSDVFVDGFMGPQTLNAIEQCLEYSKRYTSDNSFFLLAVISTFQASHYLKFALEHPNQEVFMYGWIRRVYEDLWDFMRFKSYIEKHLEDRDFHIGSKKFPVMIDNESNVAYFPLFNLSGKFIGYQRYNPKGEKGYVKDKDKKKYYAYVTKENPEKNIHYISVYGLHTLDKRRYVFVVEGIFDAAKLINLNEPVIAVMSNNPKPLKNFFFALQKKVIAILDNDKAGSELKDISSVYYVVPEPYKDLGDMKLSDVKEFLKSIKR